MGKVLVTASHYVELCSEAKNLLERNGHSVLLIDRTMPYFTFEELSGLVGDIDAAVVGLDQWNEAVFKIAPKLKIIARFGVGVDNVDLVKAKEYGIKVSNASGQNSNSVAEIAVAFMLNALRNIPSLHGSLTNGKWLRFVGSDLQGKTVGLIGFGDIARKVARKLSGFDVRLIAYDMFPNYEAAKALGVDIVSFETLLRESDIVSIHAPSNKDTFHLINRDTLALMKKGAYLINTARGALVDTDALCDAVSGGYLAGAAVDVYEQEPLPSDARILRVENIICTPHTSAETYESYRAVGLCTAQSVVDALAGKEPQNWLNK